MAFRSLARDKAFVLNTTAILAVGLGLNLAFFAVLQANLTRRPPHVANPQSLYELTIDQTSFTGATVREDRLSYPLFERVREALGDFADAACQYSGRVGFGQGASSREVWVTAVSEDYFRLMGVEPARGRLFTDGEWRGDGEPVALVDHQFWSEALLGSAIDDLKISLSDRPHTAIGILPDGFRGTTHLSSQLWVPLESVDLIYPFGKTALEIISDSEARLFQILVRPSADVTAEKVRSILRGALVGADPPVTGSSILDVHLELNSSSQLPPFSRKLLRWGALMASLTLLVACANVATLGLFRGIRSAERTVIQHQLGATTATIFRQTVTESAILAALAVPVAGTLFLFLVPALGGSLGLPAPENAELLGVDFWVFLGIVYVAILMVIAVPTGLQARRLLAGRAGAWVSQKSRRMKPFLVFIQIAATTLLLTQTGLFHVSIRRALDGLGYSPGNLVLVEIPNLRRIGYSDASIRDIYDRLEDRARFLPGIVSTARSTSAPDRNSLVTSVRGPDHQLPTPPEGVYVSGISPGYISTMDMALVAGRDFSEADTAASERVTILNERLARRFWGDQSPIGECVYVGKHGECSKVVGVLRDSRIETSVFADPRLHCYLPLNQYVEAQVGPLGDYLLVRVGEDAVSNAMDQLKAAAGLSSYVYATRLDDLVRGEVALMAGGREILALLALAAVSVSVLGVFAQLAFWVGSRRHDLGVRVALGAGPARIIRTVSNQSAGPIGAGLLLGLLVSIPVSDLARGYIFGLSPVPLALMVVVVLIIIGVGGLGCAVPCARALKIEPMEVLRRE